KVNEDFEKQRPVNQPLTLGAREKHERQEAVEYDDDEDEADGRLQNLVDAPGLIAENQEADQHGNRRHGQLSDHGHGKHGPRATDAQRPFFQFGLDFLFEEVDVVLELAREKFSRLLVDAIHVRGQSQQAQQEEEHDGDGEVHAILRVPMACGELRRSFVASVSDGWNRAARAFCDVLYPERLPSVKAAGTRSTTPNWAS